MSNIIAFPKKQDHKIPPHSLKRYIELTILQLKMLVDLDDEDTEYYNNLIMEYLNDIKDEIEKLNEIRDIFYE
jgi:hypothetical protein